MIGKVGIQSCVKQAILTSPSGYMVQSYTRNNAWLQVDLFSEISSALFYN